MHVVTVEMDRPPMTANQQRAWHWTRVREAKRVAHDAVLIYAKHCKLPKHLSPSHVSVLWFARDRRRRDADSLGPFLKSVLDALVAHGCWLDDDHRHVLSTGMSVAYDPHHPRIEIHITERAER